MLIKRKPDSWLTPNELALYIESNDKNIASILENKLKHYQNLLPDAIRTCAVGRELKLCLDKNFLDEFCKLAMLKRRTMPLQQRRDLNIAQLLRYYISGKHSDVADTLHYLYNSGRPGAKDAIVLRQYRAPAYHVYEDSIDWLLANSDLKRKKVPYHRMEFTPEDLHRNYIQEDVRVIASKLQENAKIMPESIYEVYHPKYGTKKLVLEPAALEKFVELSKLTFRPEYHGIEANIVEPFYVKETVKQMLNLLQQNDDR